MRKILMSTAAAIIAVPTLATAAMAQDATSGTQTQPQPGAAATMSPGAEAGATSGTAGTAGDAATQAQTGAQAPDGAAGQQAAGQEQITVDTVIASIEDPEPVVQQIQQTPDIERIGVVTVDERSGTEVGTRVDEAVSANEAEVATLRDAIRSHQSLSSKLEQGGLDVETVVAATFTSNGELLLFTRG